MKFPRSSRVILPLAVAALLTAAQGQADSEGVVRLSEPSESTSSYELFCERIPSSGEPLGLGDVYKRQDYSMRRARQIEQPLLLSTRQTGVMEFEVLTLINMIDNAT
mgnify:CR=1 FL=1